MWWIYPSQVRAYVARPASSVTAYQTTLGMFRHLCVADPQWNPAPAASCGPIAFAVPELIIGLATTAIGLLPTYERIGILAPILLVSLRFLQGIGVGGEWGGAVLLAVEHAPAHRKAFYGSFPQMGVPGGLILANLVFLGVSASLGPQAFLAWGWRVPFLASAVLVMIGLGIRFTLTESPDFQRVKEAGQRERMPLVAVLTRHPKKVLLAAGAFISNSTVDYIFITTCCRTARASRAEPQPDPDLRAIAAFVWLATIPWASRPVRPARSSADPPLGIGRPHGHGALAVPARGHAQSRADPGRVGRPRGRPRDHVRPSGRAALRAVPHQRPLQRRFPRLPDRGDPRRGDRAHGRGRPLRALALQRADHALPGRGVPAEPGLHRRGDASPRRSRVIPPWSHCGEDPGRLVSF
jgi:hypothetical protein